MDRENTIFKREGNCSHKFVSLLTSEHFSKPDVLKWGSSTSLIVWLSLVDLIKEHDAFWRCIQVILIYGVFQLARMFLATLELLGVLINLLAVRFTYSRMFGRSKIAVFLGCIGWSYGDLIFTKFVPIWTGTRLLEFDWAYIALSLDANFELIFNFVIFLTPWLLMRKGRNVLATCVSVLIFIVACFHLSIFGKVAFYALGGFRWSPVEDHLDH
ncbi:Transmembrane protein 147 [Echinococcus multilocularis]|uniref:BOS complex subunit TMEM147 n=1 Tax=Echinococcus multilocularis TaxID=6211 RepID=A0A0S4MKJ6_ECHMU|nr:Transmembrane protein 147 [Echinococcus multilocularis]